MINTKAVSVIIPFHNSTEYMRDCIENMIHQTIGIDKLELILVDDASDDDGRTVEVLKEYEAQYTDSIKLICLETNMRQGGARNVGLMYATGEYVAYCDSDDWMADNALKSAYDVAVEGGCDVVEFDFERCDVRVDIGNEKTVETDNIEYTYIDTTEERKKWFMGSFELQCWNKIYRREFLVKNKIVFSENIICEEGAFTFLVRMLERIHGHIHVPLYCYYRNVNSSTLSKKYVDCLNDVMQSYEDFYDECISHDLIDDFREEIDFIYWSGYFLLPMIAKAREDDIFFDIDKYKNMQNHVSRKMASINTNRYFIDKFTECPVLGHLAFVNIGEAELKDIADALREISI